MRRPPRRWTGGRIALLVAGMLVLSVAVLGGGVYLDLTTSLDEAQPGDCVAVETRGADQARAQRRSCSARDAVYRIATMPRDPGAPCPDGDYAEYTKKDLQDQPTLKLCLMLNARQGECFRNVEGYDPTDQNVTRVACGGGDPVVRRIVHGRADAAACRGLVPAALSSEIKVFVYSRPATTICIQSVF